MVTCSLVTVGLDQCRAVLISDPARDTVSARVMAVGRDRSVIRSKKTVPAVDIYRLLTETGFPLVMFLMMLGMGLSLRPLDFAVLLSAPCCVLVGLVGQMILLPLTALLLVTALPASPVTALGMIVLAACPVPVITPEGPAAGRPVPGSAARCGSAGCVPPPAAPAAPPGSRR